MPSAREILARYSDVLPARISDPGRRLDLILVGHDAGQDAAVIQVRRFRGRHVEDVYILAERREGGTFRFLVPWRVVRRAIRRGDGRIEIVRSAYAWLWSIRVGADARWARSIRLGDVLIVAERNGPRCALREAGREVAFRGVVVMGDRCAWGNLQTLWVEGLTSVTAADGRKVGPLRTTGWHTIRFAHLQRAQGRLGRLVEGVNSESRGKSGA